MDQRRLGERKPVGDDATREQREAVTGGDQREQPSDGTRAHPVIRAFAEATAVRSRASQPA